jgi:peptide/nickel transport system ATP-binding protein
LPTLLELDHVTREFPAGKKSVKAVDDVSLTIAEGEVMCLVGESGCGKTTTGKMVAGLQKPTSGRILFGGKDIWTMAPADFTRYRQRAQIIHQDPYASLNPAHTVGQILSFPLYRHGLVKSETQARERIRQLLELVDLTPAADFVDKYPHQLSGGQRQRVSIARALTVNPQFIVCDEAVSMVDVSIRISLLNTLTRLKQQLGMTFLFITHDLAIAKYFAREGRIAVMYLGRIVEVTGALPLIASPLHPYTRALLSAIPEADPQVTRTKERVQLRSLEIPSLLNIPRGCAFHPRCPQFEAGLCDGQVPSLYAVNGREVACHVVARRQA